ncbi:MAG: HGGxSTG domain-containing protein [Dongiaceae bacterium]
MTHQQLLERAGAQIGTLADAAGIRPIAMAVDLAGVGAEMLPSLLGHELAASHAAMMRLMGKLDIYLDQIATDRPPEEQDRACRQAVQLSGAAARLTERYRLGLMSLARLERWAGAAPRSVRRPRAADPADEFDDDPFDDDPGGGRRKSPAKILAELAALEKSMGALLNKARPDSAKPNGHDNGVHPQPAPNGAGASEGVAAHGRGRLRHGNPSGDFLAAPRCGAQTRAGGACRQPAMANGRCRLHGGKSTGARTAAGVARCRTATLTHGHRSAEIIALKSAAARHGRNLRALTRAAQRSVLSDPQSERPTPCPATNQSTADVVGATGRSPVDPTPGFPREYTTRPGHPTGDLPVAPTRLRSERPAPCPATRPAPRRRAASG